jgi:acetolactate synthase-1/2/3 large subunit
LGEAEGVAAAAELIAQAKRPVLFVGNGVLLSDACAELKTLAELAAMPVATTLIGKGAFPETHPLSLGMAGIWGTRLANETTRDADVVVAVGTAFGEADCSSWVPGVTFSMPATKLVQIDIEPQEIGKIYPADVGIVGDAKATLRAIITAVGARRPSLVADAARPAAIAARRMAWAEELAASQGDAGVPIHPARLLKEVAAAAPDDAVYVTDVGWNKNGAGQQITVTQPRSFITSGGMATMGFAPPAAIGAKLGAPHRKVICMVGDGGLLSVVGALTTSVELNVPVLWILFNNFCFSTIRTVGTTYFKNAYGTEFTTPDGQPYNPDFMLLAKSFGIASDLVIQPDDLPAALAKALAADVPYLLEVRTRGDVPMPRTGQWDIADFLVRGND